MRIWRLPLPSVPCSPTSDDGANFILFFLHRNVPPAHYSLRYNVMPYVGALTYGEAGRTIEPLAFPAAEDRVT